VQPVEQSGEGEVAAGLCSAIVVGEDGGLERDVLAMILKGEGDTGVFVLHFVRDRHPVGPGRNDQATAAMGHDQADGCGCLGTD
jgi:hypothetical protein